MASEPRKGEMRITDAELSLIKNTFSENDALLKVLRKVFLPEVTADAPIGQNLDLWMTLKIEDMSLEEALINLKARNTVINHIELCLGQLKVLAGLKDETVEATKERLKKDSAK
jgi:hypothetical protein